ncbi:hypothetical protein QBC47DRAFT_373528 [Echria macrotheca]|uniref:Uncharacterized protein n=1 Tax=Echria macrotheca TaxID=438768 RepID=A0AAJ0BGW3_9PEZI|nr:hypothetical protein QBC47DRAFT_373528 [Echria macrotheca]
MKIDAIRQANAAFAAEHNTELVAVFAGGTGGIGSSTLEKLAAVVESATFYIAGRSTVRFAPQRAALEKINPNVKIVFFECDISLLADVDAFAKLVRENETKVDYLYMSPGVLPLVGGAQYTKEGLERSFALSYYSRLRLTYNLLPLLQTAPHPRVLSVLNGGREAPLVEDDLGMEKNWTALGAMGQVTTLNTLAFDHLASQNHKIAFIHAFPGFVKTEIGANMKAAPDAGILGQIYASVVKGVVSIMMFFLGITPEESGERMAYHLTSSTFAPGVSLLNEHSEVVPGPSILAKYRADGWPDRVWEFTQGVFDKVAQRG